MRVCDKYFECKFIEKYEQSSDPLVRGLIKYYCRGNQNQDCARKSTSPGIIAADMLPTGEVFSPQNANYKQYNK
jgi:hypothetical protein